MSDACTPPQGTEFGTWHVLTDKRGNHHGCQWRRRYGTERGVWVFGFGSQTDRSAWLASYTYACPLDLDAIVANSPSTWKAPDGE